jgi:uncharacterized protein (DUF697 family)
VVAAEECAVYAVYRDAWIDDQRVVRGVVGVVISTIQGVAAAVVVARSTFADRAIPEGRRRGEEGEEGER